jgi:hypothetical protein
MSDQNIRDSDMGKISAWFADFDYTALVYCAALVGVMYALDIWTVEGAINYASWAWGSIEPFLVKTS